MKTQVGFRVLSAKDAMSSIPGRSRHDAWLLPVANGKTVFLPVDDNDPNPITRTVIYGAAHAKGMSVSARKSVDKDGIVGFAVTLKR